MNCSPLMSLAYVIVNAVAELHRDYAFLPTTEYATPAMLTQQLTPAPRRAVTPATTVTAVDGGVGADAMDRTPRKFSHRIYAHARMATYKSIYLTDTNLYHCTAVE